MSDSRETYNRIRRGEGLPPIASQPKYAATWDLSIDEIRREAFELLGEAQELTEQGLALYTCGVTDLVLRLSKLAGEEARETCLDKNGEARG